MRGSAAHRIAESILHLDLSNDNVSCIAGVVYFSSGGLASSLASTARTEATGNAVHSVQGSHRALGNVRASLAPAVERCPARTGEEAEVNNAITIDSAALVPMKIPHRLAGSVIPRV